MFDSQVTALATIACLPYGSLSRWAQYEHRRVWQQDNAWICSQVAIWWALGKSGWK